MKKKLISGGILVIFIIFLSVLCVRIKPDEQVKEEEVKPLFKLGVILPADETEQYTKEQIDTITDAMLKAGLDTDSVIWKERVAGGGAYSAAKDLVSDDCTMIVATCGVYTVEMTEFAAEYPQVQVVTVTDTELLQRSENLYTVQLDTRKACYISGVIAGMKLADLHEKGKIPEEDYQTDGRVRIGYVAKYGEAESSTEYMEFLRGVRSTFSKVTMEIRFTGVRLDLDAEASAADTLIRSGCVLIACNTESERVPAVVNRARENGNLVYLAGYHDSLPEKSSTECTGIIKDWKQYYNELFGAVAAESEFPAEWKKGYDDGIVTVLRKKLDDEEKERIKRAEKIWEETNQMKNIIY